MALCEAHGLTLDWLYRGKARGLPLWLAVEVLACSAMLGCDDGCFGETFSFHAREVTRA
jgi:hypothetical protein